MYKIFVKNDSKKISDTLVKSIIKAQNMLLPIVCNEWKLLTPIVYFLDDKQKVTNNDWIFYLDDSFGKNSLAYHTETFDNKTYGVILVSEILKDNGFLINNKDNLIKDKKLDKIYSLEEQKSFPSVSTISSALCHEIIETLADKDCNSYWQSNQIDAKNVPIFYCSELCDMVQDKSIVVHCDGLDIYLSDFVTQAWKDPNNNVGPYDYLQILKTNFSLTSGGYAVIFSSNNTKYVMGKNIPKYKEKMVGRLSVRNKNCEKLAKEKKSSIKMAEVKSKQTNKKVPTKKVGTFTKTQQFKETRAKSLEKIKKDKKNKNK